MRQGTWEGVHDDDKVFLLYLSGDVKDVCLTIIYLALTIKLNGFFLLSISAQRPHIFVLNITF